MDVQYTNGETFRYQCVFEFPGLKFGSDEAAVLMNFTVPITTYSVTT